MILAKYDLYRSKATNIVYKSVTRYKILHDISSVEIRDVEAIDRFHFGGWDSY